MSPDDDAPEPLAHWEERYAGAEPVWSGEVNATLAEVVGQLPPGRSIDLGCGEGGDVLWLAEHGWDALGLDLSPTAIDRAQAAATARSLAGSARFAQCDLSAWRPSPQSVELVTASFFHSQVALERTAILRRAAGTLTVGGRLVLVSHAAPPPWAADQDHDGGHADGDRHAHEHGGPPHEGMRTAREEAAELDLPAESWTVELAEQRHREATGPAGQSGHLEDSLLVLRRIGM